MRSLVNVKSIGSQLEKTSADGRDYNLLLTEVNSNLEPLTYSMTGIVISFQDRKLSGDETAHVLEVSQALAPDCARPYFRKLLRAVAP